MRIQSVLLLSLLSLAGGGHAAAPEGPALATIDLTTTAGVAAVKAGWRYSDVQIVPAEFRAPDANGQPTGDPVATFDFAPHAGAAEFDDSAWQAIAPDTLASRRGHGRLSFNWYRIRITLPAHIGQFDPRGSTLVFSTSLDDYAEVWVDGELPRAVGQAGGSVVAGWNARNRLVIATNVQPGRTIQLAVFGINGPISGVPTNFIWMREARLEFYPGTPVPMQLRRRK